MKRKTVGFESAAENSGFLFKVISLIEAHLHSFKICAVIYVFRL
jgi:hypothetical protein